MELKEINSLVELFFKKFEQINSENFEKQKNIFLVSLKGKSKSCLHSSYSWLQTNNRIKVEPKPKPTPNRSHKGKNLVGLIFLFFISFSKN